MYLVALIFVVGILWALILLVSRSLLSRRYGHRLATNSIAVLAFCSLTIVSITYTTLNNNLENIRTYSNNPPVAIYGFAIFSNLLASAAVFIGSTVVITILAAIVLEIHRWRQRVNKQPHIKR
jgi:flagellar biosynthesis protein FlhB